MFFRLAVYAYLFALCGCVKGNKDGSLLIRATAKGRFEIFRVTSEQPLQLVSEQAGQYNQELALTPGSYLVFADCSSEMVVIKPGRKVDLIADTLEFRPPRETQSSPDSFTIQCTRHEKTQTRQRLSNDFVLNVLRGQWEILVGMSPMTVPQPKKPQAEPQRTSFELAAVRVNTYEKAAAGTRYFVSSQNSKISVTASQKLGEWTFLLAGDYTLELNGAIMPVSLPASQLIAVEPAFVRVATPDTAQIELAPVIQGNPLFVEINGGHWLNLNETYPVLPGNARLRLYGSDTEHSVVLTSGELTEKKARAVRVDLDCPPWDWTCLGSHKIYLYGKDAHYPFATGVTDVPLLYFEDQAWLAVEGSRDIRLQLNAKLETQSFKTGELIVRPIVEHKHGMITDLVRFEPIGAEFVGNTLDIALEQESRLLFLPGSYHLVQYFLSTNIDGDRRKLSRRFDIQAFDHENLSLVVYVSEKRFKALKQEPADKVSRQMIRRRLFSQRYRTPRPLQAL